MSNCGLVHDILEKDKIKEPRGWINFKSTDVCLDLHCECGRVSSYDGFFCHYLQCPYCDAVYAVGSNVKMYPLTEQQIKEATATNGIQHASVDSPGD